MAVTNMKSVVLCLALITMLLVSHVDATSRLDSLMEDAKNKLKEKGIADPCKTGGSLCGFGKDDKSLKEKTKNLGDQTKNWLSKTFDFTKKGK